MTTPPSTITFPLHHIKITLLFLITQIAYGICILATTRLSYSLLKPYGIIEIDATTYALLVIALLTGAIAYAIKPLRPVLQALFWGTFLMGTIGILDMYKLLYAPIILSAFTLLYVVGALFFGLITTIRKAPVWQPARLSIDAIALGGASGLIGSYLLYVIAQILVTTNNAPQRAINIAALIIALAALYGTLTWPCKFSMRGGLIARFLIGISSALYVGYWIGTNECFKLSWDKTNEMHIFAASTSDIARGTILAFLWALGLTTIMYGYIQFNRPTNCPATKN